MSVEKNENTQGFRPLYEYEHSVIRVTDRWGHIFTGVPVAYPAEYGYHEFGRDEENIELSGYWLFASDIAEITELPAFAVLRATETWQQAGAYYVRIQAMAKKHQITLRQEFDEHDGPDTRYIVVTDRDFPIATARMYPLDRTRMMIGRVVVLPEYRRQGIGTMVVHECERWAEELGFFTAVVDSRENKVPFYKNMLYEVCGEAEDGETFRCVRMEKEL